MRAWGLAHDSVVVRLHTSLYTRLSILPRATLIPASRCHSAGAIPLYAECPSWGFGRRRVVLYTALVLVAFEIVLGYF